MANPETEGQTPSSPWKEHKNRYFYANWDQLSRMEPETIVLLKKEAGTRVETNDCC